MIIHLLFREKVKGKRANSIYKETVNLPSFRLVIVLGANFNPPVSLSSTISLVMVWEFLFP